jgi:hypothetical protein
MRKVEMTSDEVGVRSHCYVIPVEAQPWSDAVDRAYEAMSDRWDSSNALGYPW